MKNENSSAIWQFIEARGGESFTAQELGDALPTVPRATIRSQLYWLARRGFLEVSRAKAYAYIYRRVGTARPDGEPALAELANAWARIARLPRPEPEPEEGELNAAPA